MLSSTGAQHTDISRARKLIPTQQNNFPYNSGNKSVSAGHAWHRGLHSGGGETGHKNRAGWNLCVLFQVELRIQGSRYRTRARSSCRHSTLWHNWEGPYEQGLSVVMLHDYYSTLFALGTPKEPWALVRWKWNLIASKPC